MMRGSRTTHGPNLEQDLLAQGSGGDLDQERDELPPLLSILNPVLDGEFRHLQ